MLMVVKKHLVLIFTCFKYNLLKEMEYRISFIFQIIGMVLNDSCFILQWLILFSIRDNIGGYNFHDVMILWAVAAGVYGVTHIFFVNTMNISDYIVNGKLDTYLVQPKNVLISVSSSRLSASAFGDLLYGYLILIFLKVNLVSYLLFTILIILGALIQASFIIIIQSLAFWLKRGDSIADAMANALIIPSTYPEGIFKGFAKIMLFSILPIGFMIYIPVRLINIFSFPIFGYLIGFTIFIVALAFIIFNNGLKKYSSSNLMIARM